MLQLQMHIVYYVEKTLVDIVLKIRHEIALYSIQNVKKESCVHFSCVSLTFMSDVTGLKQCTLNERACFPICGETSLWLF